VDRVGDPVRGVSNAVVDAGLTPLGAGVPGAHDADQGPPALDFCHEGSARIALAGVLASLVVSRAHHLVVDDDPDALVAVPVLALAVVDGGNVDDLKGKKMNQPETLFKKIGSWKAPQSKPSLEVNFVTNYQIVYINETAYGFCKGNFILLLFQIKKQVTRATFFCAWLICKVE
jgi:hypothetical protein